ncbi:hypothetical protein DUI87_33994 [Hirundo rustica rustica]|uniref:Core shell protein Gag P30 domain-containing protein n=1 Tax=Hirundo rustica rustica TaxID=333673 RepID=A0A3M0INE4_HIRRU|nr:hypothetical protein DUI87_33994 [Hirundo rustica rustica]
MINYCMFEWTKEIIWKDNLYGARSGLFEDWICQALNLYVNSKEPFNQEESEYAALWLPRGKGEFVARRQGSKGFPFNPLQTRGQAAKKDRHELYDPLDHLPPPYRQPNQPVQPQAPEGPPVNANSPPIQEEPVAHRSRGEGMGRSDDGDGEAKMEDGLYPLRKVPMANPEQRPIGDVSVPLSTGDVREFKKEMGRLIEDPLGVAERLDQFLGPNIYTWVELQSILGILFTMEEREMIRHSGMRVWDRECQGPDQGDQKWPMQDPGWNNQNERHRQNMSDLWWMIIRGIWKAVPKGQNIGKARSQHQGKDEPLADWSERLRKALQVYSGVDPYTAAGQVLLKTQFVAKAWGHIRKKLEKVENWQDKGSSGIVKRNTESVCEKR